MKMNNEDFLNEIYVQLKEIQERMDKSIKNIVYYDIMHVLEDCRHLEKCRDEIKKITKEIEEY